LNYYKPNIPNRMIMNDRNNVAFPSSGNDCNKVLTNLLILEIALMLLNGLKALRILSDFRFTLYATKSVTLRRSS